MGFVRPGSVYRLVFEDDLEGLVVRVRPISTGQVIDMTKAAASLEGVVAAGPGTVSAEDLAAMEMLFAGFAAALVGWNLEDCGRTDGKDCPGPGDCSAVHVPVPADLSGVRSQDAVFVARLIREWMRAAGGVQDPLAGRSGSGGTFPEASIPMEPLSAVP